MELNKAIRIPKQKEVLLQMKKLLKQRLSYSVKKVITRPLQMKSLK